MELFRLQDELSRCGLQIRGFDLDKISNFIDTSLKHGDQSTSISQARHSNDCNFVPFEDTDSSSQDTAIAQLESEMYDKAMQVYCDLNSRKAFDEKYQWPDMQMKQNTMLS